MGQPNRPQLRHENAGLPPDRPQLRHENAGLPLDLPNEDAGLPLGWETFPDGTFASAQRSGNAGLPPGWEEADYAAPGGQGQRLTYLFNRDTAETAWTAEELQKK